MPGAQQIGAFNTDPNLPGPATGVHADGLTIILAVGVVALLLPLLVFIATATRLATTSASSASRPCASSAPPRARFR